jgi:hypothetical protein
MDIEAAILNTYCWRTATQSKVGAANAMRALRRSRLLAVAELTGCTLAAISLRPNQIWGLVDGSE